MRYSFGLFVEPFDTYSTDSERRPDASIERIRRNVGEAVTSAGCEGTLLLMLHQWSPGRAAQRGNDVRLVLLHL